MTARVRITDGGPWTRLNFTSPILSTGILKELLQHLEGLVVAHRPAPLIIASDHPTIFLAGAHLGEIAGLDADSSVEYAALGRAVIAAIVGHPAATVAAVHGSCSGGGFDLVLACDRILASSTAALSHPGVQRGLVTGWGGTTVVPVALGRWRARRALLEGEELSAEELEAAGVVCLVEGDLAAGAEHHATRLAGVHPDRLEVCRRLRSGRSMPSCGLSATRAIIGGARGSGQGIVAS